MPRIAGNHSTQAEASSNIHTPTPTIAGPEMASVSLKDALWYCGSKGDREKGFDKRLGCQS
jgi:hypothetical protein